MSPNKFSERSEPQRPAMSPRSSFYHGTWALLDVQVRDYCSTTVMDIACVHILGQHHLMAAPGKSGSKTIYAGGEAGGADGGLQVVL